MATCCSRDDTETRASSERFRNRNPSNQDHYSQLVRLLHLLRGRSSRRALRRPPDQNTQSTPFHRCPRALPRAVQELVRVFHGQRGQSLLLTLSSPRNRTPWARAHLRSYSLLELKRQNQRPRPSNQPPRLNLVRRCANQPSTQCDKHQAQRGILPRHQ